MYLVANAAVAQECVILLHGLGRTARSMKPVEQALRAADYHVENIEYPSRLLPIEDLAKPAIEAGIKSCSRVNPDRINFVTHSMGGILVRYYLAQYDLPSLGRVVMLAPPNQGSEVVDNLKDVPGFDLINGPAGAELGTDPDSIPSKLGPVAYPVGVIAGSSTINPILSQYLPNPDDGKVSVARTRVDGMADFLVIRASHPLIMRNPLVIQEIVTFLRTGSFDHDSL